MIAKPAIRIFVIYLIIGALYIYFSDTLSNIFYPDPDRFLRVQNIKGIGFIVVSGLLILFLINRQIHRVEEANRSLNRQKEDLEALTQKLEAINRELNTEKVRAEESDRLKSAFLQNISHEIRTPMNGLLGFSRLLVRTDLSAEERVRYSEIIHRSGDQLLRMINDIMDLSHIETGQLKIEAEPFSLNELIRDMEVLFRDRVKDSGKPVSVENHYGLKDGEDRVVSDRMRLYQVLSNLLSNAFKFTDEGSIRLGYAIEKRKLVFKVEDTGTGISKDLQESIFERFKQGNPDVAGKKEGAGLGLAIARGIVESMGGKIVVSSEPGRGTLFMLTLPYRKASFEPDSI